MFSITFNDDPLEYPYDDPTLPAQSGTFVLGNTFEGFRANLNHWNRQMYESHWRSELKSLVGGADKIALIVDFADREHSSNVEVWACYRDEEVVHVQNHLLFYDDLPAEWHPSTVSRYLKHRQTENDTGDRISEWSVSIRDVELFLYRFGVVWRTVGAFADE